ncbi:hypothetical protein WN943_028675 [Citrus x changshan-huyou]
MISNQTRIRPSPLPTSSATRQLAHSPLLLRRVRAAGFTPRTDFSCKLSHGHESYNFPEKIIATTRKRGIRPPNIKQSEVAGAAAGAGEDEEEEEEKKESGEPVEDRLSEEEKKKICEFAERLGEEEKIRIFEILMGLSEEEKRKLSEIVEEWNSGGEDGKIGELVEGLSREGKRKLCGVLKDLSDGDKEKITELLERLNEKQTRKLIELVESLSEEGLKRVSKHVLASGGVESNNAFELLLIDGLSKEDRKRVRNFACSVAIFKILLCLREIVKVDDGISKEELVKDIRHFWEGENNTIAKFLKSLEVDYQDEVREIRESLVKLKESTEKEKKKSNKDSVEGSRDGETVKIKKILKRWGLSEKDMKPALELVDGLSEGSRVNSRKFLESLEEEAAKILKLKDLANGFLNKDLEKYIKKASLNLSPRLEFIKKVSVHLGVHLLSGIVAYASMKMCPPKAAAFKKNYSHFLSPLLFLIPTCKAFKKEISKQKYDSTAGLLVSAVHTAFGVFWADVHLANSNGRIMLAALLTATYILFHVSLGAVFEVVVKDDGDLSCFRPSNYSLSMTIAFLVSFLQIFNRGLLITAIDAGFGVLVFTMFALYDAGKILKRSDSDDHHKASAHLYWDLYGLFICSVKMLSMLHS